MIHLEEKHNNGYGEFNIVDYGNLTSSESDSYDTSDSDSYDTSYSDSYDTSDSDSYDVSDSDDSEFDDFVTAIYKHTNNNMPQNDKLDIMISNIDKIINNTLQKQINNNLSLDDKFNIVLLNINKSIDIYLNQRYSYITETEYDNYVHFKHLCESLNTSNNTYIKIKHQIAVNYIANSHKIYVGLLKDIYNASLSDFTINFLNEPSQSFKCLKIIIQKIPYFDMMINDCNITDSMTIIDNYDTAMILMKLLYFNIPCDNTFEQHSKIVNITNENVIDVLLLTDKYLVTNYVNALIVFIKKNIMNIIRWLLDNNKIDKLVLLEQILCNIVTNNIYHECGIQNIINIIYDTKLGEHVFMFNNWENKFSGHVLLDAIKITNQYDLLDKVPDISPLNIVSFLNRVDYESNIYYKISKCVYKNKSMIFYTYPELEIRNDNFVVITNYYPKFTYVKYSVIKGKITKISDNGIHLKFHDYMTYSIPIGTKIIFNVEMETKKYTINKIIKYSYDYKIDVPHLYHHGLNEKIKYEIYFDEPIETPIKSNIWMVESYEHDIKI